MSCPGLLPLGSFFSRVELLLPYVPVAGLVCGGGPHGVWALSLRKMNKHMRCMNSRCIVVALPCAVLCVR